MHLVLRSEKARDALSLLSRRHEKVIRELVSNAGKRYQVRIYQYANGGNHLHLLVRGKTRKGMQDFLRYIAGKVAQHVTDAKKGNAFGKFWESLAYSRVVEWGKAYTAAKRYVFQNELEASGEIPYQARKRKQPRAPDRSNP